MEQLDALESKMNDWLSKDEKRMYVAVAFSVNTS
jgi:hypothetical protein